ncbi:hypothetical protein, partial [Rhodomicrobium vannielii]|uniref:hypothetical protein n=1 Tax=Rhodomicrobium vannielii TaxID=1069 RepID=UPI001AED698B
MQFEECARNSSKKDAADHGRFCPKPMNRHGILIIAVGNQKVRPDVLPQQQNAFWAVTGKDLGN